MAAVCSTSGGNLQAGAQKYAEIGSDEPGNRVGQGGVRSSGIDSSRGKGWKQVVVSTTAASSAAPDDETVPTVISDEETTVTTEASVPVSATSTVSTTATSTVSTTATSTVSTTATSTAAGPPVLSRSLIHVDGSADAGGDGSSGRPFSTLAAGLSAVEAGQILMVHGGEYRERINLADTKLTPGTVSEPVLVTAAHGERVVVRGVLRLKGLRHWTIDGINVTWDDERNQAEEHMVVFTDGAHWQYRNSEVWGARSHAGILVAGSPVDWALRGLYVHDTYASNDTNQDHLIYCNCGSGGGVIERNLLVRSPNGRAIKFGTVSSENADIANVVVRYNTMVDNQGPSNVQFSYRTSNIIVENNIMVGADPRRHNVTTYALSGTNNVVRNNIGWDSQGVTEENSGIVDGGGNMVADPEFGPDYRPGADVATGYGHTG